MQHGRKISVSHSSSVPARAFESVFQIVSLVTSLMKSDSQVLSGLFYEEELDFSSAKSSFIFLGEMTFIL